MVGAPALTGTISSGTVGSGIITVLSIPISPQTRDMVVITAQVTSGIGLSTAVTMFVSSSISTD